MMLASDDAGVVASHWSATDDAGVVASQRSATPMLQGSRPLIGVPQLFILFFPK